MYNWKKAAKLAAMEMRESAIVFASIASLVLVAVFFVAILGVNVDFNGTDTMTLFDIIFAVLFVFLPVSLTAPKFMPMQRSKTGTDSAPAVMMLMQLPVKRDIIGKSRFILNMTYTGLYAVLIMPLFYFAAPFKDTLSPLQYTAFSIFWICFALLIGGGMKLSGDFYTTGVTVLKQIAALAVLLLSIALVHYAFVFILGTGAVHASVLAAKHAPVITSLISLALAATGLHFTHLHNVKIMHKKDFL